MNPARVRALRIAPVKGLATVMRPEVWLGHAGVAGDRRLFLLRADGSVVTLRRLPTLAQVVPSLDLDAGTIAVRLPDGTVARSDLAGAGEEVAASLFGRDRSGRVLAGAAADALSAYVGEPLRLVLGEPGIGWDEGPVSIISRASVDAVGPPPGGPDPTRYRMLVELDGLPAYAEDAWVGRRVRLGEAVVEVSHALDRCVVVNASPVTGEQDWAGLKTLAAVRGQLTLGVIATVAEPGVVAVADAAEVLP